MPPRRPDLETLDRALIDLRHFLTAPRIVDDHGRAVELSTLLVLDGLPPEGQSVREVAARLDVAPSTASRLVTRADRAGMTARTRSTADTRETLVVPTAAGLDLAARAVEFRLDRLAAMVGGWATADVHRFARDVERFAASFRARERA